MKFTPEIYRLPDIPGEPFIDPQEIEEILAAANPTKEDVRNIIQKSLNKNRLNLSEVAALLNTNDPELVEEIKQGAKTLNPRGT